MKYKSSLGVTRTKTEMSNLRTRLMQRLHEAVAIILVACGVYVLIALLSYYPDDPSWVNTYKVDATRNLAGVVGAWIAQSLNFLLGYVSYLIVIIIFLNAYRLFQKNKNHVHSIGTYITVWVGYMLCIISLCGLVTIHFNTGGMPATAGGWIGGMSAQGFINIFGILGATLLLLALFIGSLHLVSNVSWLKVMDATGAIVLQSGPFLNGLVHKLRDLKEAKETSEKRRIQVSKHKQKLKQNKKTPRIEPSISEIKSSTRKDKEKQMPLFIDKSGSKMPSLRLLNTIYEKSEAFSKQSLEIMAKQLEIKLSDFNIEGKIVEVQTGPVITRFELEPAPGIKAKQITNLENDLARALSVLSVRVVEVIPGKSSIGIEIPNEIKEIVSLKEILSSEAYDKAHSPLTLALGKNTAGSPVLVNLQKMPHLLVAGTTGAGKSVGVHAMLMSILFKSSPREVRFILIDPKMLELNAYDNIPHLLMPVITDMKNAMNALRWAVNEMERRYSLISSFGVRNVESYNREIQQEMKKDHEQELEFLSYIVIVIDEFADMMMTVGKPIEDLITRLAQKARAAGMHLILATQRPSVNVITGLIKANIPSRIAFQVSSKIDSRTILDQNGAEQLLGQGDMLFLDAASALPERVHGAFVSDKEVKNVTQYWQEQDKSTHVDLSDLENVKTNGNSFTGDGRDDDPLYGEAVAIVLETHKTSISYIQRRLKVGYNRAARMIELMEEAGVISGVQADGKRKVITHE